MSHANVEVVQRIYDAFERRDLGVVVDLITPDIEIVQSEEIPWGGTYRGQDEMWDFFGKLLKNITSKVTVERFIDAGDDVVAIGWTRGTINETGRPFDVPVAHLWHLRDGRAARVMFCIDNPTMRAALG